MYISTAYCCCDEPNVEEKLYPLNLNPRDVINFVYEMNLSSKAIAKITTEYDTTHVIIFNEEFTENCNSNFWYKMFIDLLVQQGAV